MTAPVEPRALIVTNNKIQPFTAGGIVIRNLFSEFARENLFVLHADTAPVSDNYEQHRLGPLRVRWRDVPRLARLFGRALPHITAQTTRNDVARLAVQCCGFEVPESVDAAIRAFAPDVMYAWAGDSVWIRLVEECAERYSIPYVVHFMDNHVELSGGTPLQAVAHAEYRRNLTRLIRGSDRFFAISRAMGEAYEEKFSRPFEVFHAGIDLSEWPLPVPAVEGDPFTFVFLGSVEQGQLSGLRAVAASVDRLGKQGRRVRLVLYLNELYLQRAREGLAGFRSIEFRRHPDATGLREAMDSADVLVLAYGFESSCIEYYRYSFATKTPAYMASGRCVLAYGPAQIEPIAYVERGSWGLVVSDPDPVALDRALVQLMDSPERRHEYAVRAFRIAAAEHELSRMSSRFRNSMAAVASCR